MSYQYKPAEAAIISKIGPLTDHDAITQATSYLTQGALSVDAFVRFQGDRLAAAKVGGGGKLTLKVARSGAVSLYGLGRFPVTLYAEQWERVLKDGGKLVTDFINSNPSTDWPEEPAKGKEPAKPACKATIQRKGQTAAA